MAKDRYIYGEINNETDLRETFASLRRDVEEANSRPLLTEFYQRAGEIITLTQAPAWDEKFGSEVWELRQIGAEEFTKTVREINRRAQEIGTVADYNEKWGA